MSCSITCPECKSGHTARCELIYERGVSTVVGPRYITTRTTAMALKASPPTPPASRGYFWMRLLLIGGFGYFLIALALALVLMSGGSLQMSSGCLLTLGALVIWRAHPPKGSLSRKQHWATQSEYKHNLALYKSLWMCVDCGQIFQPKSTPLETKLPAANRDFARGSVGRTVANSR